MCNRASGSPVTLVAPGLLALPSGRKQFINILDIDLKKGKKKRKKMILGMRVTTIGKGPSPPQKLKASLFFGDEFGD